MNIVDFINEMGENGLLCDPQARYTKKQKKITGDIFSALKVFREKNLRDATDEEFQLIGKEVENAYKRAAAEKRKNALKKQSLANI